MNDREIEELMKPFQSVKPSFEQLEKWKKIGSEVSSPKTKSVLKQSKTILTFFAGMAAGFLLFYAFKNPKTDVNETIDNGFATAMVITVKSN